MGDDARKKPEDVGILFNGSYQNEFEEVTTSIGIVTNEELASKYLVHPEVDYITVAEINSLIDSEFQQQYSVTNEAIMNANLGAMASNGTIDFSEMKEEWSNNEELSFLYSKGVSGIRKIPKPPYLTE